MVPRSQLLWANLTFKFPLSSQPFHILMSRAPGVCPLLRASTHPFLRLYTGHQTTAPTPVPGNSCAPGPPLTEDWKFESINTLVPPASDTDKSQKTPAGLSPKVSLCGTQLGDDTLAKLPSLLVSLPGWIYLGSLPTFTEDFAHCPLLGNPPEDKEMMASSEVPPASSMPRLEAHFFHDLGK